MEMTEQKFEQTEAYERTFFGEQEQLYKACREFKQEILKSVFLQRIVEGIGKFFDCILKKL